jgi:Domain of unknown function (DUF4412)
MKNLIIAILLVFSVKALAQSFEGTITWTMSMEITDPNVKAQMEQAQKSMQDPEKLKQMREQMENPQMKAMMEKNPQMKAQMERALAMMEGGGSASMMPSGMVVKMKDGNVSSKMEGGMMQYEFLFLKGKNKTYMVDRENKTYMTNETTKKPSKDSLDIKVTKTDEKAKILGYTCTKYVIETTASGVPMTQNVWATREIKDIDLSALARQQGEGSKQAFFLSEIDGVPLKMQMNSPQGIMTMEVKSIKRGSLPESDFIIPADYKETKSGMGF